METKHALRRRVSRRTFLGASLAVGAGAWGTTLIPEISAQASTGLTDGDAAILRFLAALEILETDFWQQYTEFANLDGPYSDALEMIDEDMPSYVTQNTNDEFSHQDFLNAFLVKMRKRPVNLERFRTLPSSPVGLVTSTTIRMAKMTTSRWDNM